MIIKDLDYKYAIYGIAKSIPYVICFEKYKKDKLYDSVFIIADEIDSNHCEKTYVHHSTSNMQNIIAYKRYISFSVKHLILRRLVTMNAVGTKYMMLGAGSPIDLIYNTLNTLFYKGKIDELSELPLPADDEIHFSFINQKLNQISDLIKIVTDYDDFMSSANLSHTLTEIDDTKIVLRLSTILKNDTVMRKYNNDKIKYKIFNSLKVEHESILEYLKSWYK